MAPPAVFQSEAEAQQAAITQAAATEPAIDDERDAAEADGVEPRRQLVAWNHYQGPYFTLRVGGGFGYDYSAYAQDANSKEQMTLSPVAAVRDFRVLLKGKFPAVPRLSYTLGYMYDGAKKEWFFRQTGLMVDVPELSGDIFIGRTKEGFSTNKIMVGYFTWTCRRRNLSTRTTVSWSAAQSGCRMPGATSHCCTSPWKRASRRQTTASCSIGPGPKSFRRSRMQSIRESFRRTTQMRSGSRPTIAPGRLCSEWSTS